MSYSIFLLLLHSGFAFDDRNQLFFVGDVGIFFVVHHPNGADILGGLFVCKNQVNFVRIAQLEDSFREK
jgi:hypothetical protein